MSCHLEDREIDLDLSLSQSSLIENNTFPKIAIQGQSKNICKIVLTEQKSKVIISN